ncbi:unnamed protein product [Symbiodinium pilosum]|uniref:Uncharacterized protein n=1 Tax=Symbiodinium pilosum TaxID=2952 RepID=A0A812QHJ2_SYMPI|nr:unnamed protein product [Symbiodinium pilosum]
MRSAEQAWNFVPATEIGHARHWCIMIAIVGAIPLQVLIVMVWFCVAACCLAKKDEGESLQNGNGADDSGAFLEIGASEEDIARVFEGGYPWGQLAVFAWRVVRSSVNLFYMIYMCVSTAPLSFMMAELKDAEHHASQSSSELWCFERHAVVLLEGVFAFLIMIRLVVTLLQSVCSRLAHRQFKSTLERACSFSAFNLLPMANPAQAIERTKRVAQQVQQQMNQRRPGRHVNVVCGLIIVLAMVNMLLVFIPLAVMSVMVKVSKLGFMSSGQAWTWREALAFVMFINALAGLRAGIEKERERTIFETVGKGTYHVETHNGFMGSVFYHLQQRYGIYAGLAIYATLSPTQVCKLLNGA